MSALPYSGSSSVRTGAETCSFGLMLEPGFYSGSLKEKEEHVSIEVRQDCLTHNCSVSASSAPAASTTTGCKDALAAAAGWWQGPVRRLVGKAAKAFRRLVKCVRA